MRRLLILIPIVVLVSLFALFSIMILRGEKAITPSRLVGTSASNFTLETLDGGAPVSLSDFQGKPVVVNFFASWCAPCRVEHPMLMELAAQGITIIGVNYKDKPEAVRAFMEELGNPFAAIGQDVKGRTGIDYGITGVPETFVIGPDGRIITSWASPLDKQAVEQKILPALVQAAPAKD